MGNEPFRSFAGLAYPPASQANWVQVESSVNLMWIGTYKRFTNTNSRIASSASLLSIISCPLFDRGYTIDSRWRNRSEFINGRIEIIAFLSRKERDYRLIKEMWAFTGNRIAVRFAYEWHDDSDHWYRSYGNENWEFSDDGLMASRFASINDTPILGSERKISLGARASSR